MPEVIAKKELEKKDQYQFKWGALVSDTQTTFRIFSPNSKSVIVEVFDSYDQKSGDKYPLSPGDDGSWHVTVNGNLHGKYYGYRLAGPNNGGYYIPTEKLIADPYSRHVTSKNHYLGYHKTLIPQPSYFDWGDDTFIKIDDPRDLIIYEAHIKDLTAHASSEAEKPGTYLGFIEKGITGGIEHLKKLGVNAVEFLPLQKFAGFEPPYDEVTPEGDHNTWNPYSRNYWGYMTSFFFAPETEFASDGSSEPGKVIGISDRADYELKSVVRELHKEGIAVIMDVVYNHVSQYDLNPLKFMDKEYFFRLNDDGNFLSHSGCGNDFRTESPLARKLIVDSILYWMKEYHIDGFRFDLANLIDRETIALIKREAEKINPDVILIAEPWGGGYDPTGFSRLGWPAWNDQIRNGVKGSDPVHDRGFIFGEWQNETSREGLENFIKGTLIGEPNGRFLDAAHSVNYLESHDGYTLGDFIRIGLHKELSNQKVSDPGKIVKLDDQELRSAKLAAMFLFVSQGIVMIHEGQEWARPKIIEGSVPEENHKGFLDHNSYEKDDTTNYLNFDEIKANPLLFDYYCGLIDIRKKSVALRKSPPEAIHFHSFADALQISFHVEGNFTDDPYDYVIALNGNRSEAQILHLPDGFWELIASARNVGNSKLTEISGVVKINPTSGMIFRKLRE